VSGLRILDLFCGEGGASKGYEVAGLELLAAIDDDPERARGHYAWDRGVVHVMDWRAGLEKFAREADLIHASPPCQLYSTQTPETTRANWPDLIPEVRDALRATGKPYVIENVQGARSRLIAPVELNGLMFPELQADWDVRETVGPAKWAAKILANTTLAADGKWLWNSCRNGQWRHAVWEPPTRWRIHRTRLFEVSGFTLAPPPEIPSDREVMSITRSGNPTMVWNKISRQGVPLAVRQEIMGGLTWMSAIGVGESIPPPFAAEIGRQFLQQRRTQKPDSCRIHPDARMYPPPPGRSRMRCSACEGERSRRSRAKRKTGSASPQLLLFAA
jgi:hypothetical protein